MLCDKISTFDLTEEIIVRATRHIKKPIIKNLFSSNNFSQGSARGHLYEAIIYEIFLELIKENELIKGIVRRGADVTCPMSKPSIGQNGFFYNENGEILIRGNGIDLAEVDLLLIESNSNLSFIEMTTSKQNLKDFEKEIEYKKRLIGELNCQQRVPFLLISSIDITHNIIIQNLLNKPSNFFVRVDPFEKINKISDLLYAKEYDKIGNPKLICLKEIKVNNKFDYIKLHDELKNKLFRAVKNKESIDKLKGDLDKSPFVAKVILGSMYPNAIKCLFRDNDIIIDGERWDADKILKYFNKLILAINIPELRPLIYLRMKKKHNYLKIGPITKNSFKSERVIGHFSEGLLKWFDTTNDNLGYNITNQIFDFYLNDATTYSKRYKGTPSISKLIKNSIHSHKDRLIT